MQVGCGDPAGDTMCHTVACPVTIDVLEDMALYLQTSVGVMAGGSAVPGSKYAERAHMCPCCGASYGA